MLRKLVIWVALPILALITLVSALVVIALRTDVGRNAVLGYALPVLQEFTGLKVEYKDVAGPWPNRFIFHDLVLSDDEGVWFSADYFAIDWSPLRLFANRLMFPRAEITNGYLRREPVMHEAGESTTPSKLGHPPMFRIRTLIAKRFHLGPDVLDQELTADIRGRITLEHWRDLKVNLNADIDTPGDFSPHLRALFGDGFKLHSTIEGNIHQSLAISELSAQTRDGRLTLKGAGDYVIHTHAIDGDFTGTAAPGLAPWITGDLQTKSPIALHARLFGPFKSLSIKAEATFKDASFSGAALPPFVASGDIVLTHSNVAGPVAITFMDAGKPSGKLAAALDYEMSGRVKLAGLTLDYGGAKIKGAVDLETDPKMNGSVSFNATIPELSKLPVDLGAKGDLKASGQVRFDNDVMSLDAKADSDHLVVSGVDIKTLAARLKGRLTALNIAATAQSVTPPAIGQLSKVDTSATLGLGAGATTIRFAKLTSDYAGEKLRLGKPATLTMAQDRLALDKIDISWGEDGHFTGMAEHNGEDLRLLLKIAKFNPPQGPTRVDGVIDVDTRRASPGKVQLSFVPTDELKTKVRMEINGKWDKKRLTLVASFQGIEEADAFKHVAPATFSMPLALAPGKALSFSTEGPIDGRIAYGGPITPFVALVPMPQQTLNGSATINIAVSGTLDNPVFAGKASLKDGKYQNVRRGIVLDKLNLNGRVDHSSAGYMFDADLSASDGRKHPDGEVPIKAKTEISLGKGRPKLTSTLDLKHAQLVHLATATSIASGHFDVGGTFPDLRTTGTLNIELMDINIPDAMPSDIVQINVVPVDAEGNPISPEEAPVEKDPYTMALDCNVIALGNINIKGRGLDFRVAGKSSRRRYQGCSTNFRHDEFGARPL